MLEFASPESSFLHFGIPHCVPCVAMIPRVLLPRVPQVPRAVLESQAAPLVVRGSPAAGQWVWQLYLSP